MQQRHKDAKIIKLRVFVPLWQISQIGAYLVL